MAFDDLSNAQLELITKLAQKLATEKFRPEFRVLTGLMSAGPEIHLICVDGELVEPPIQHFRESTLDALNEKGYVTLILGFMGITDVQSVVVAPTLMGDPAVARSAGLDQALALAKEF